MCHKGYEEVLRMKRKKKGNAILLGLGIVFLAVGCGKREEAKEAEVKKTDIEITLPQEKEEEYTFVDVYGNSYTAPLLKEVPKHSYDFSNLKEENGFKAYYDKAGNKVSTLGIDVSKYQSDIDWKVVKEDGIEFAIIRLGFRGYGDEGTIVLDEKYEEHIKGALAEGLKVGVYFFSQAVNDEEALEEAEFVLEHIKEYPVTYPVIFDTEEIKDHEARTDGLSGERFTKNCKVFCDAVETAGYDAMVYANMKWMAFTLDLEQLTAYQKWYADYEAVPQCPYEFSMWQYTEEGKVNGIEGNVDINLRLE